MNKKAYADYVVIGFVSVGVLAIIFSSVFRAEIWAMVKNKIPGFTTDQPPLTGVEILRFSLSDEKIQRYDGTHFWDFENGKAKLGTKNLEENKVKNDFKNYFYDYHARKNSLLNVDPRSIIAKLYDPTTDSVYQNLPSVDKGCIFYNFLDSEETRQEHTININLVDKNSQNCPPGEPIAGIISLRPNNQLDFLKVTEIKESNGKTLYIMGGSPQPVKDNSVITEIKNKINNWKFSILSQPIQIYYTENSVQLSGYFCTWQTDNAYLNVDLSKPVNQDTKCT